MAHRAKSIDRRKILDTLALHLAHVENLRKHKAVYKKYQSLVPKNNTTSPSSFNPFTKSKAAKEHEAAAKKHGAYYDKHAVEIRLYEKAKEHFDAVMNGRKDLPVAKWHTEQKALTAERFMLAENYYRLKDEVKSVEVLRRGLKELMQDAVKSEQHKKIRVAL